MSAVLREVRRAPLRIVTSVLAVALAVGAVGVLAIPAVSASSLRAAAERDRLAQVSLSTSDLGDVDLVALVSGVDHVIDAERQTVTSVDVVGRGRATVIGTDVDHQRIDVVAVEAGRLPRSDAEVLTGSDVFPVGSAIEIVGAGGATASFDVVGSGTSTAWFGEAVLLVERAAADVLAGVDGGNRIVVRTDVDDADALRTVARELRDRLADRGVAVVELPTIIPDGRHPIEADIEQVSTAIGFLGIVAGLVAMVLLGSTTTTLVVERSREVAVMRALGVTPRAMRRRLRRIALGLATAGLVVGLPLGVLVANVIARLVMQEFAGLTPRVAVSWSVMVGSAVATLVGARVVAAGAARRLVRRPLVEALRDRDGSPFGGRWGERVVGRLPTGGLLDRAALRHGVHRRARQVTTTLQIAAAVGGLVAIASLATTVNDFNAAELEPWTWSTRTTVVGSGLDIDAELADGDPQAEVTIDVVGEALGWQVDVRGFEIDTRMVTRTTSSGDWFTGPGEAVLSAGFADRVGLGVGDAVEVELGSGWHTYEVVGLHPDRGRTVFVDRDDLASDLGRPGFGNALLSLDDVPATMPPGRVEVDRLTELNDGSGRTAILTIFAAIGAVVVSVAGLAVASGLVVDVHERRREFAAMRAIGGRRRHVLRVVVTGLVPTALAGLALGVGGGYLGAAAIMESFEAADAVEIGFTFAAGAIPAAAIVVLGGSVLIAVAMVREVTRRPIAEALRGAA